MTIHGGTDLRIQRQIETSLNIGEPDVLKPHLLLIKEAVLDTLGVSDGNDKGYDRTINISQLSEKIQRVIEAKTLKEMFELLEKEDLEDNFDLTHIYEASEEMRDNPLFNDMKLEVSLRYLAFGESYAARLFFPRNEVLYKKYFMRLLRLRENKEGFDKLSDELRKEYLNY